MVENKAITSLVFSGGLGLGAYHGGAFEAFEALSIPLDWVTGSSAGAITAAIIGGSPRELRLANLRDYWQADRGRQAPAPDPGRHVMAWMSSITTHALGRAGFFYPRMLSGLSRFNGLYDLAPTRARLQKMMDFGRLNAGDVRITIAATDLQTGDAVLFDSESTKIEMDHILASCGFVPEFAPVSIDGRWFADGGFSYNAPFDPVLESMSPVRVYIIDLYGRDGPIPDSLEAAAERKNDLLFGNQTYHRLRYALENRRLQAQVKGITRDDQIYLVSYRPGREEAGPEKSFDLSKVAMTQRWHAGFLDMRFTADSKGCRQEIRTRRRQH